MWQLGRIHNPSGAQIRFSDGGGLWNQRGGSYTPSRLIVENQGFLDFLELETEVPACDAVASIPCVLSASVLHVNGRTIHSAMMPSIFHLTLPGNGSWSLITTSEERASGHLKPLPEVSTRDVVYLRQKIRDGFVPYPQSAGEGRTSQEIKALGTQYFPFSPFSYELAMVVYDWTTASFARMVLPKIFEYTSMPHQPYRIDKFSLATAIYNSSWSPFVASNPDFMRSFLMRPASSLDDVLSQLDAVLPQLQEFSAVENRLLHAALLSLPRTSTMATPVLYSGQIDMSQLSLSQFAAEFHQFPLNAGPEGVPLELDFPDTLSALFQPSKRVTTKQAWSFSDSMDIAMHYQNGIILIVRPSERAWTWDIPGYVTPLSFEDDKIEWVFPPGTSFVVESVQKDFSKSREGVYMITLRSSPDEAYQSDSRSNVSWSTLPRMKQLERHAAHQVSFHIGHISHGGRCRCMVREASEPPPALKLLQIPFAVIRSIRRCWSNLYNAVEVSKLNDKARGTHAPREVFGKELA